MLAIAPFVLAATETIYIQNTTDNAASHSSNDAYTYIYFTPKEYITHIDFSVCGTCAEDSYSLMDGSLSLKNGSITSFSGGFDYNFTAGKRYRLNYGHDSSGIDGYKWLAGILAYPRNNIAMTVHTGGSYDTSRTLTSFDDANQTVTYSLMNLVATYHTNFKVYAYDFYTGQSLTNFSISAFDGTNTQVYSTTNGTIDTNYTSTSLLLNITVSSTENGAYYNKTYTNYNVSTELRATLAQSEIIFYAYEKMSSNMLSSPQFTTTYLANTTHYMRAGSYSVTASKSGFYNRTISYTATALSSTTTNVSYMYNNHLNLTIVNNVTGAAITSFSATLISLNNSYVESLSTTNGSIIFGVINGSYTLNISTPGYVPTQKNVTVNSQLQTINTSTYLFAENSIYFNIYNATSLNKINGTTTIQIYGASSSINTTTNGTIFISGLTPGYYNISIASTGFETTQYSVTVGNNSFQYLNAYLESLTSNSVVFTALDDDTSQALQDVLTNIEKRINGTYYLVGSVYTDITGRFELAYSSGDVYRFTMSKEGYVDKTFELNPIIFTSYNVRLLKGQSANLDVSFSGISIDITPSEYINNQTNQLTFTIGSPDGQLQLINYTLIVSNNGTLVQNSSSNAYGATLTSSVPIYNAVTSDNVILYYTYISSEGVAKSFSKVYSIAGSTANTTRFNAINPNQFGMPLFDRVIILFLIVGAVAGLGGMLEGSISAGFLSLIALAYFGSVQFVTWWVIIPSMIIIGLLTVWRLK